MGSRTYPLISVLCALLSARCKSACVRERISAQWRLPIKVLEYHVRAHGAYELTHLRASRRVNLEINDRVTSGGIYGDFILKNKQKKATED